MQANNTHIQTNPKHTLWEGFMVILKTSKNFIIPFINHQNQPLDWIFASPSTLRSRFSCTSVGDQDLITFHQIFYFPPKKQHHTTYLFCCSSSCHSIVIFFPIAFHLVGPLLHNHPASSNNTHIPNRRKWHKDFNTINTTSSPFSTLPCLHAIESKHY